MRGLRSAIALLVILVGLGAYIYFVAWEDDGTSVSTQERVFASLEPADIQQVQVKSESGDTTTVKKEGDAWQVVAPVTMPASAAELASLTSAIGRLEISRVVDEDPADLAAFGLAPPRVAIDFTSAADKPSGRLLVGNKTPTGGSLFAKRADQNRVFLIAAYLDGSLNRSTFDLRDKALVKFDPTKVDAVALDLGGRPLDFKKDGNSWMMVRPLAARADNAAVEALVRRVETGQMKSIVTERPSPADLKKYGLERPEVTVTLNLGSAQATLAIGGSADADTVYARDASRDLVMTVEKTLADDVKKEAVDYRLKDAFEFRIMTATRAEFTRNGQTVAFEHVRGEGENTQDSWRRASPSPADADRTKVEALLTGLVAMRATSFTETTANTGLEAPILSVFVTFEEGKREERVTFGKSGNDLYAARPDQPGALKLDGNLDEVIRTLDELSK